MAFVIAYEKYHLKLKKQNERQVLFAVNECAWEVKTCRWWRLVNLAYIVWYMLCSMFISIVKCEVLCLIVTYSYFSATGVSRHMARLVAHTIITALLFHLIAAPIFFFTFELVLNFFSSVFVNRLIEDECERSITRSNKEKWGRINQQSFSKRHRKTIRIKESFSCAFICWDVGRCIHVADIFVSFWL